MNGNCDLCFSRELNGTIRLSVSRDAERYIYIHIRVIKVIFEENLVSKVNEFF